jgi:valyl-tRNA synthetase
MSTEKEKTSEIVVSQVNRRIDNLDKRLTGKFEDLQEAVSEVRAASAESNVVLRENTESLKDHMKRTAILEERQGGYEASQKAIVALMEEVKLVLVEYKTAKSFAKILYKPASVTVLVFGALALGIKAEDIISIVKALL